MNGRSSASAGFLAQLASRGGEQPLTFLDEAPGKGPAAANGRTSPPDDEDDELVVANREDDEIDGDRKGHAP